MYSKPVYGTNTSGMRIPLSDWLFSKIAATILGKANALPFRVWASLGLSFPFLKRRFHTRLLWKVSKFDTELTSSQRFWRRIYFHIIRKC